VQEWLKAQPKRFILMDSGNLWTFGMTCLQSKGDYAKYAMHNYCVIISQNLTIKLNFNFLFTFFRI